MKLYKAINLDGTDFHTGTLQWAPRNTKARKGRVVKHPTAKTVGADASEYLSVSVDPLDLPGAGWPMRMLVVEPVGELVNPSDDYRNKRAAVEFRVVEEIDPSVRFGPQGPQIAALLERARTLTYDEAARLDAAWDASRDAAWDAARGAARDAAWDAARGAARGAAWDAARGAARGAAWGLLVRDLITTEHYDRLTGPWRQIVGPVHPDDAPLSES